jgi:hypothetical protein
MCAPHATAIVRGAVPPNRPHVVAISDIALPRAAAAIERRLPIHFGNDGKSVRQSPQLR